MNINKRWYAAKAKFLVRKYRGWACKRMIFDIAKHAVWREFYMNMFDVRINSFSSLGLTPAYAVDTGLCMTEWNAALELVQHG